MQRKLTFGSLFAGVGGFDLGFERAGMECKWQVEIDDYATKVLERHWPNVHRERDIRLCGAHNLERVDVICGGFPCQDISYAGRGAGLDGERSGLFFEAIRLVRELQPRMVVLENVAALLTRGLDRVLGTLAEIGLDAEWHCIPAASVGAPHIRDRVFVLAYRFGDFGTDTTRTTQFPRYLLDEAGRQETSIRTIADTNSRRFEERTQCDREAEAGIESQQRHNALRCGPRGWWGSEPAVGRVADGVSSRVDRLRCLGNAVVPQVAEFIGKQIVAATAAESEGERCLDQ